MTSETNQPIMLSKKGIKELKKNISKLERTQSQLIKRLHDLDKTDNHEQRLTRVEKLAELEITESQLSDKQSLLRNAKQFPRKRDAFKVAMGSVVELIDLNGRLFRYTLVDSIEANPSDGRISISSPLGQNLIGRTIQDTVKWGSGVRQNQLTLVGIR